ncbi:MAG: bifunctional alpha,alpha-trehalose-phosphate synthase (UDP-forming)/trehalose-phosphatase [Candidatus Aminicenantes bacterium]|nr:bifunctional alpha,alpha-trehalose-phosphate synthase (UDP-forming)/trehalose-phosphatase [Candidatus Aminicenantes bacterium]
MGHNKSIHHKLIVVSNRLPVTVSRKKGKIKFKESPGGLATGLRSLKQKQKVLFIGWPGYIPRNNKEKIYIRDRLIKEHQCYPVFLKRSELDKYYYGFSNRTLWPLFHYFTSYSTFEEPEWNAYKKVNRKFFKEVLEIADPDSTFWVHDYHLMLLPKLIRTALPQCSMGFFLHIPFPSSEIFRVLPWRTEILEGLLGADLLGFHTYEYARHFLSSALRLLGYEHEFGAISVNNRIVRVDNFPMGVDIEKNNQLLADPEVQKETEECRKRLGKNNKIILSVDRLDYSKGIPHRLRAFESFLAKNRKWRGKITYIMLCVPSRTQVSQYKQLKKEIDRLVGNINGKFGSPSWTPVNYIFRSRPFKKLISLYAAADIALVTPVRDGMNLVAKEYVAAKKDNNGVLILSGTAGAAEELSEALIVNVHNKNEIIESIKKALTMSSKEKTSRMKVMRKRILEYDIKHWTQSFINSIIETKSIQDSREKRKLNPDWKKELMSQYQKSRKRLLLFDYDGTLISYSKKPEDAKPDNELKRLLISLSKSSSNKLVVISGRDRNTMEKWLGDIPCSMVAEHGSWIKTSQKDKWEKQAELQFPWKNRIKPILKNYESRVPGSFVEEKEFGLAWHYRNASPELGYIRSHELFDNLNEYLANTDLQLMHGNKVIEIRIAGINKGIAAQHFLKKKQWDFILALGDDWTDEELFKELPPNAYSIKIGYGPTQARLFIESPQACRSLLLDLSKI